MRLIKIIKLIVFFVIIWHIQHFFMLYSGIFLFDGIEKTINTIGNYSPFGVEMAMFYTLPYSLISLFIIPLFYSKYDYRKLNSLGHTFLLFIVILIIVYIIGLIISFFILVFSDIPKDTYLFYTWPVVLGNSGTFKLFIGSYIIGNIAFSLFFIPFWHYYLKKFFIKTII